MKLFLDTADTELIEKHFQTDLIDGITTNPTLIMKSGRDPEEVYQQLIDMGIDDISMEVVGDFDAMYMEGLRLSRKFGKNATIKVPCTPDGLKVCKRLSRDLVNVNVTLIFSVAQAILAASVRDVKTVSDSFGAGAHVVTMPPSVFEKMYNHVLTDKGLYLFDMDWAKVKR